MSSFKDKVVLVTGASSGIGAAIAISFAEDGAKVAIVGRNEAKLANVIKSCTSKGLPQPLVIKADISNDAEASTAVNKTVKTFGKLDILVNNAGIFRFGSLLDGNIMKAFDEIMAVNLRAQVYVTSLAVSHLIKTKGNIINISSVAAQSLPFTSEGASYHVSKVALNMFTRTTALELAAHGVRVNSVSPGPVDTDIFENSNATFTVGSIQTALGRVSQPVEVTELVKFLASDKAVAITGSDFVTDNGYLLRH